MATTLQRKSSGGVIFVMTTNIITKESVPRNYFVVIISARMVNSFKRNSLPPTPHRPNSGPQKNVYRDPHELIQGRLWGQERDPKRPILGHKKFGLLLGSAGHRKLPWLEESKKSLGGSLRGVPADPQKRVEDESQGDSASQKSHVAGRGLMGSFYMGSLHICMTNLSCVILVL